MDSQLRLATSGTSQGGQLNSLQNWKNSIVGARPLSGYSFLAVEERVTSSKGFELKTSWMTVSNANKWRSHK